jgi:hypothetical protein
LTATATAGGQQVDVTTSVTWTTDTTLLTVQNGANPMCVTSLALTGTTTIFATYLSGNNTITSNSVGVTVTQ